MSKKLLVGLLSVLLVGFMLYGCGKVAEERIGNLPSGVNPGDPIPDPKATVSGAASYSGGNVITNLSPIIPPGETDPVSVSKDDVSVYISSAISGSSAQDVRAYDVTWTPVDFTITETVTSEIDMAFILDNTGSMADRIQGVKDSIITFADSLEAMGGDIRFAGDVFGDYIATKESMGGQLVEFEWLNFPSSGAGANELKNWLNGITGFPGVGYDDPENPLDAIMFAYDNFTWRTGARKVLVAITDTSCHQVNPVTPEANYPFGDTTVSSISSYSIDYGDPGVANSPEINIIDLLKGNAVVYAVSPSFETLSFFSVHEGLRANEVGGFDYFYPEYGCGDIRNIADGLGASSRYGQGNYPLNGTGGLWIELPPDPYEPIDLTQLGISGTLIAGSVTLTLPYDLSPGTYYIMVYVDTDGNGIADSYGMITIVVS